MLRVVNLSEYRNQDVAETLRELHELGARVHGLAFVALIDGAEPYAGMAGEYKRHPEKALQATFILERHLARTGPFADSAFG